MFDKVGLHDSNEEFFTFLPRKWPLPHRSRIKMGAESRPRDPNAFQKYVRNGFIHADVTEYSERLLDRIKRLLDSGFGVLTEAYFAFRDFDLNVRALNDLKNQSESYALKFFN